MNEQQKATFETPEADDDARDDFQTPQSARHSNLRSTAITGAIIVPTIFLLRMYGVGKYSSIWIGALIGALLSQVVEQLFFKRK